MACITTKHGKQIIDYYDSNKKRHQVKVAGTKEDALIRLAEILKGGKKPATKKLFKEHGEWWLANCAKGEIKESTYEEYERVLKLHVYPTFGSRPVSKISRKDMKELITALRKKGLSRSSIRNVFAPIRAMFNQLIEDDELNFNPAANIGKLNKKRDIAAQETDELDEESVYDMGEVARALDKAKEVKPRYQPVFACGFLSGLRMGEQIALRPMDLDFDGHLIRVRRNYYRGRITTPKGNRRRNVDMEPELEETLSALVASKKAAALRDEFKKPASERRLREKVIQGVMEDLPLHNGSRHAFGPRQPAQSVSFSHPSRTAKAHPISRHATYIRDQSAKSGRKHHGRKPASGTLLNPDNCRYIRPLSSQQGASRKPHECNGRGAQGKTHCLGEFGD